MLYPRRPGSFERLRFELTLQYCRYLLPDADTLVISCILGEPARGHLGIIADDCIKSLVDIMLLYENIIVRIAAWLRYSRLEATYRTEMISRRSQDGVVAISSLFPTWRNREWDCSEEVHWRVGSPNPIITSTFTTWGRERENRTRNNDYVVAILSALWMQVCSKRKLLMNRKSSIWRQTLSAGQS